jgi:phytoene desaturase
VLVVGAGLGGLAAAVRLQSRGYQVTVLERHDAPGGRCGVWESAGFRFDTGPTLLLMVEHLHRLFRDAGRAPEEYLRLLQLDPGYRIHYADGETLTVSSRLTDMLAEVERLEPGAGPRFLRFLADSGTLYRTGVAFVDRNVHRPGDFFRAGDAGLLLGGGGLGSLRRFAGRYFRDERLVNAVTFQALYLGLSPFDAMAIYALLAHAEIAGGLWFPVGGMHALPRALERLARELGAEFEYGAGVAAFEHGGDRVTAARLADGTRRPADLVLCNADLPYAYETLLGEPLPRAGRLRFSCSAFLMYLGVGRAYPELPHHTLVVPASLRRCCGDIFERRVVPADPAFYICNPSKTDPSLAPPGCENLYVLVPVPSAGRGTAIDWNVAGPQLERVMLERLERFGLTDLRRHLVTGRTFTPADFTAEFGATRGEAFGLSHGFRQIGWFRPHNRHARYANLFFVGQSTHPGCGVPMQLIGARCVAERIASEQPA